MGTCCGDPRLRLGSPPRADEQRRSRGVRDGQRTLQTGEAAGGHLVAEVFSDRGPDGSGGRRVRGSADSTVGEHGVGRRLGDRAPLPCRPPAPRGEPRAESRFTSTEQCSEEFVEASARRARCEHRDRLGLCAQTETEANASILMEHPALGVDEMIGSDHDPLESDRAELPGAEPAASRPDPDPRRGVSWRANRLPEPLGIEQRFAGGVSLGLLPVEVARGTAGTRASPERTLRRMLMGSVAWHLGIDHRGKPGPGLHDGFGCSEADGFVDQIAPAPSITSGDHDIGNREGADGGRNHAQHDDKSRHGHLADVSQWRSPRRPSPPTHHVFPVQSSVTPHPHTVLMVQAQLLLLPNDTNWHLDPSTRRIGREGLAQARAALAAASATSASATTSISAQLELEHIPAQHEHSLAA